MRVVTNDDLINRNRRRAQIIFFVSIAVLIGSFFLNSSATSESFFLFFQCGVLPAMFLLVLVSVRMTNTWVRQPHPWEVIREGLKGYDTKATLYNFMMPANHVLVTQSGIFAIETRFQDTPQKVEDDKWRRRIGLFTYMRQEQIGNPSRDALYRAAQTEVFLQELLEDPTIKVQALVVFTHPDAKVTLEGEQTVPVLYASTDKKSKSLKTYLKNLKEGEYSTLRTEQQDLLDDFLLYEDDVAVPDESIEIEEEPVKEEPVKAEKKKTTEEKKPSAKTSRNTPAPSRRKKKKKRRA